ncbi:MAG: photosystem II assembly protein Psb35 [Phormidesmis sp.]
MSILLQAETAVESAPYAFSLGTVGIVGFIAAVTIGSIAWYNSKRPTGWESKERPDIVPDIKK